MNCANNCRSLLMCHEESNHDHMEGVSAKCRLSFTRTAALAIQRPLLASCFLVCPLQVSQGNVPGVESASLAMDTEEGVEVVWNEVLFSDKKVFKAQEVAWGCTSAVFVRRDDLQTFMTFLVPLLYLVSSPSSALPMCAVMFQEKIKEMFENLMQVEHPNIVKFHKYWLDMKETQARVRISHLFFFPLPRRLSLCRTAWRRLTPAPAHLAPTPPSPGRSYSSPSTCRRGASNSS